MPVAMTSRCVGGVGTVSVHYCTCPSTSFLHAGAAPRDCPPRASHHITYKLLSTVSGLWANTQSGHTVEGDRFENRSLGMLLLVIV